LAAKRRLVSDGVGGEQRDRSLRQVAMRDGIARTVRPAELGEGVQLDRTAEDLAVEGQSLASGSRQVDVRGGVGHATMLDGALLGGADIGKDRYLSA
jgi:hypothetical protein